MHQIFKVIELQPACKGLSKVEVSMYLKPNFTFHIFRSILKWLLENALQVLIPCTDVTEDTISDVHIIPQQCICDSHC